jgi:hypothetical protein
MIGKPLLLMESCDVVENFKIIASSLPYFENDFRLCIKMSKPWQTLLAYVAHFIDRVNRESAAWN